MVISYLSMVFGCFLQEISGVVQITSDLMCAIEKVHATIIRWLTVTYCKPNRGELTKSSFDVINVVLRFVEACIQCMPCI